MALLLFLLPLWLWTFSLYVAIVTGLNVTELDCNMRKLAFQYAQKIQPWWTLPVYRDIHDALRIKELCHESFFSSLPVDPFDQNLESSLPSSSSSSFCQNENCVFVNPNTTNAIQDGFITSPVKTIDDALILTRSRKKPSIIVLRHGIHTIKKTIQFDFRDDGLKLIGYPGEDVWISGGVSLNDLPWKAYKNTADPKKSSNILVTDLTDILNGIPIPKIPSLFSKNRRYIRARYPNSNPEIDQWGYASPDRLKYSIPVQDDHGDIVLEWNQPPPGEPPTFELWDFQSTNHPSLPHKDDSTMAGYNLYASGHGGVCADVWGPAADSYWCSNASAGGWAEVDIGCATSGQLQLPISMTYNQSHPILGRRIPTWATTGPGSGGYIHVWHSQSWAMHMFEISNHSVPGTLTFQPGGGRQGGRNWCRCDQCTYVAPWCGQHHDNPDDTRLISGTWLVEHILEELDSPGEFYFNSSSKLLYLYPNTTSGAVPHSLRFAVLETLLSIHGTQNMAIENINFRDTAATFLDDSWSAPSGGDWSLHRGGAIFMEGVSNMRIRNCLFRRLDGNAIFLSGWTRHVKIQRNIFEWIGENAIATWGVTKGWNATERNQPIHTVIEHNIFRELGIYEKQSSAVGQAKAAKTKIRYNIMFNMPRAAINFNDMMGGGDVVMHNLIFNTCRESGDHGPINTWDRQPFLTTFKYGSLKNIPSFTPLMREIGHNFIFANYGADEAIDNDDGSSWYHVHHNVLYDSQGFKMDYGGHDSIYEENLVIMYPGDQKYSQNCIDFATFLPGHGHIVRKNKCIVPIDDIPIAYLDECLSKAAVLEFNSYFSPSGSFNITFVCEDLNETSWPLSDIQSIFGLEIGSTVSPTPSLASISQWTMELLGLQESATDILWKQQNNKIK